jgi:drug/metabolite transporter (DMT)-like permease
MIKIHDSITMKKAAPFDWFIVTLCLATSWVLREVVHDNYPSHWPSYVVGVLISLGIGRLFTMVPVLNTKASIALLASWHVSAAIIAANWLMREIMPSKNGQWVVRCVTGIGVAIGCGLLAGWNRRQLQRQVDDVKQMLKKPVSDQKEHP